MKNLTVRLDLDLLRPGELRTVCVQKGDTARSLEVHLYEDTREYRLTEDCCAVFTARKPDGSVLCNDCQILDGAILYRFTSQTTSSAGTLEAQIRVYGANQALITTAPIRLEVCDTVAEPGDAGPVKDEMTALDALVSRTTAACNAVEQKLADNDFRGESAYETAVRLGYTGTEQAWLDGLRYDHSEEFQALGEQVRQNAAGARNAEAAAASQADRSGTQAAAAARSAEEAAGGAAAASASAEAASRAQASAAGSAEDSHAGADAAASSASRAAASAAAVTEAADAAARSAGEALKSWQSASREAGLAIDHARSASASAEQARNQAVHAGESAQRAKEEAEKAAGVLTKAFDDGTVSTETGWTSKRIVDMLCSPFRASGAVAVCQPIPDYPLSVRIDLLPRQGGSGTPGPGNERPFLPVGGVRLMQLGRNILNREAARDYGTDYVRVGFKDPENQFMVEKGAEIYVADLKTARACHIIDAQNRDSYFPILPGEHGASTFTGMAEAVFLRAESAGIQELLEEVRARAALSVGTRCSDQDPYTKKTFTVEFASPVYGCSLDWNGRKLEDRWEHIVLNGTEPWDMDQGKYPRFHTVTRVPVMAWQGSAEKFYRFCRSSRYTGGSPYYFDHMVYMPSGARDITFSDSTVQSREAWIAKLRAHPVEVCYRTDQPALDLPVSGIPVAIPGTNTLYTDTGTTVISGRSTPQGILALIEKQDQRIAALENRAVTNI